MPGSATKNRAMKIALALGAAYCTQALGVAQAQSMPAAQQPVTVDIPAGDLGDSLMALGRQAKVQIAFLPDRVAGRKSKGLRGDFTVESALARLLDHSGLRVRRMPDGSYVVGGPTKETLEKARRIANDIGSDSGFVNGDANIPDILVRGLHDLTLNTDIPRSENEAQPYTVFSRDQIKRSGSLNLEDFLRDNLGAMTNVKTSAAGGSLVSRDSNIILRGLGADSTLILVDGRRYAEPNNGINGSFTQSSVSGIPLEQIERVEVLASSAAGQYGSNAVGGVINIVLRRDFHGFETSAYIGGTTQGDAIERRLSANATFPILPKTTLSLSGSWKKADPLYAGDTDFVNQRLQFILKNNPKYLETADLIYSTTPNIRSADGTNLVLRPQYAVNGVTALNSAVTFVPAGYRGITADGTAALLANAGHQNLEPGPGNTGGPMLGDRYVLLGGQTVWNGTATLRSDVTHWLSLYGSASYSRVKAFSDTTVVPTSITIAANSPLNPFTKKIQVTFPSNEPYGRNSSVSETTQFIGGAIFKLPFHWQVNLDVNTSKGSASVDFAKRQISPAFADKLSANGTGVVDVLRDTLLYPIDFEYDSGGHYPHRNPSKSSLTVYSLKLAGPLGFARLWGGKPVVTLVGETQRQWMGDSIYYGDSPDLSTVNYMPERSQNTNSVYGELVLPIVGTDNHIPLISEFELRLSGRYDAYTGRGTNSSFQCIVTHPGTLTEAEQHAPCPRPGLTIPYRTVNNGGFNPVIAAKWSVTPDIAFRGSFSTGYTPPQLSNIVPTTGVFIPGLFANSVVVSARDPLRGNELIGTPYLGIFHLIEGLTGGNPDIKPQKSTSWSFGTILTPRFLTGLTLRADWTKITILNGYYDPVSIIQGNAADADTGLTDFMDAYPERFRRGPVPAGDPYTVGPVIFIDATTANLSHHVSESVDFSGSYITHLGDAQLEIRGSGTLLLGLKTRLTPSAKETDQTGVVSPLNLYGSGDNLKFRGNVTAAYSTPRWNIGIRTRYFSGYYLNTSHITVLNQGSNRVAPDIYFDFFGGIRLLKNTDLSAGINNLLNGRPSFDAARSTGFAPSGDPRLRTFNVNITQRF